MIKEPRYGQPGQGGGRLLWVTVLLALIFLTPVGIMFRQKEKATDATLGGPRQVTDQGRIAQNRQTLKQCHDPKLCVSCFVKWEDRISIISSGYPGRGFVPLEHLIEIAHDDKKLNEIVYIRIPSDSAWSITATAYARQFVSQQ